MKVLVVGEDGHAHALVWKLFNSPQTDDIVCAPGNGGTSQLVPSTTIDTGNVTDIASWAFAENIDVIVPVSSQPIYAGLVDEVVSMQVGVCAPPQRSAQIARSRCAAKDFLLRHALPTPPGRSFSNLATAEKYLATQALPVVIKTDNPTLGGGTFYERYAAIHALHEFFNARAVEGANEGVVIESFLTGIHLSFSVFTDGHTSLPLLPTRVYGRFSEEKEAAYAPGMGAHTSTSMYARRLMTYLHQQLMMPLVAALQADGLPYWGILGIDCVVTSNGPRITGVRTSMRDMEAQVVLPRLEDDLVPILQATITRRLDQLPPLNWRDVASIGIALVTHGYPNHFPVGSEIQGLTDVDRGVLVFHDQTHNSLAMEYRPTAQRHGLANIARTIIMGSGPQSGARITTTGGHVATVVAMGATLQGARGRALLNAERITFAGRYYRDDIGRHDFKK